MSRFLSTSLAAGLLLSVSVAGAEEPAFGEAVNGLRISLEVRPAAWRPGDAVEFACTVRNVSDKPIRVAAWGLDLSPALEVTDPNGKVLPHDGGRDATRRMPADAFPTIPPGELRRFTLSGRITDKKMLIVNELLGGIWHWTLADGDYTVRAVLDRREDDEFLKRQAGAEGMWTGRAFSAPVKVQVGDVRAPAPGAAVNGLKMTISADKTELRMTPRQGEEARKIATPYRTEPAEVRIAFTNVSDKPIKLGTFDLVTTGVRPDVTGPDPGSVGIFQQRLMRNHMAVVGPQDYPMIAPGETWTCKETYTFPSSQYEWVVQLRQPGEFRLRLVYARAPVEAGKNAMAFAVGAWAGTLMSNEIVLKGVTQ